MSKSLFISLLFFLEFNATFLYSRELDWMIPGNGSGSSVGKSIVVDGSGNVYTTGTFSKKFIAGQDSILSRGNEDVFLLKTDARGIPVWLRALGSPLKDLSHCIEIDKNGNIIIAGGISDSLYADNTLYLTGGNSLSLFTCYYDSLGNFLKINYSSNGFYSEIYDIQVQDDNSVIATGVFYGQVKKDSVRLSENSGKNFFLMKIDSSGFFQWGNQSKGQGNFGAALISTKDGYYVTGGFGDKSFFDSVQLFATSTVYHSLFVARYSLKGKLIWIKAQTGSTEVHGYGISMNTVGNIMVAGEFMGQLDSLPLTSKGSYDVLLLLYTQSGSLLGYKQQGGVNTDSPVSVTTNGKNFIVCGVFGDVADFADTLVKTSGINSGFIEELDEWMNGIWFRQLGGTATVENKGMYYKDSVLVVTGGFYEDIIVSRPGFSNDTIQSTSAEEQFFIAHFSDTISGTVSSVNEIADNPSFGIFPNPAGEFVGVEFYADCNQPVEIDILDISGRRIQQEHFFIRKSSPVIFTLNKEIKNGMYILLLNKNGEMSARKLMVSKLF